MRIKLWCNSGANHQSTRRETIDTVIYWGLDDCEWEKLTEDEKYKYAEEWAYEKLDIGFEELDS